MSKIKIEIKHFFTGSILFEYESENNTLKNTLQKAVGEGAYLRGAYLSDANLSDANLRGADLSDANLRGANLRGANLRGANLSDAYLRGADLRGANLRGADLEPIKLDFFTTLLYAIPEIGNLKKALNEGRVDGSTYEGICACLVGTLNKSDDKIVSERVWNIKNPSRPIERFFLGIQKGDKPDSNCFSKLAIEWIEEFESMLPEQIKEAAL